MKMAQGTQAEAELQVQEMGRPGGCHHREASATPTRDGEVAPEHRQTEPPQCMAVPLGCLLPVLAALAAPV